MQKRDVVRLAFEGHKAPYVPWSCTFTMEAAEKLQKHFGDDDLDRVLDNHFVMLGDEIGFFTKLGSNRHRDVFGVVWDRSIDKDIGNVEGCVLPEPTLAGYELPDRLDNMLAFIEVLHSQSGYQPPPKQEGFKSSRPNVRTKYSF